MLDRTILSLALLLPLTLAACGPVEARFTYSGTYSESDRYGVSGGGFHIEKGEPAFFHGTVLEKPARRYTYLVIVRDMPFPSLKIDQSMNEKSSANGEGVSYDGKLDIAGVEFEASFAATIGERGLEGAVTTLNGRTLEAGQWLFLLDAKDPDAGLVPVEAAMPEVPVDVEEVAAFTNGYVAELAETNEAVRAFLDG